MKSSPPRKSPLGKGSLLFDQLSNGKETTEFIPAKYAITSYGADFDVESIYRRLETGSIILPSFQRDYVWKYPQACRFIESLLLGLPTPGIFLAREESSENLLVLDGHQRLTTVQWFFHGKFEDPRRPHSFELAGVVDEYAGKTYETLSPGDRTRLGYQILHATIVRQDMPTEKDPSSIYEIFMRLNTGGTSLLPQEIRAAVYRGPFNDLLHKLNVNRDWRRLLGSERQDPRMRDQEIILRFLALYVGWDGYKEPMTQFLNSFMARNQRLADDSEKEFTDVFDNTVSEILSKIGPKGLRIKNHVNVAMFDALAVGVASRLHRETERPLSSGEMMARWQHLQDDPDFHAAVSKATANSATVRYRISSSIHEFSR